MLLDMIGWFGEREAFDKTHTLAREILDILHNHGHPKGPPPHMSVLKGADLHDIRTDKHKESSSTNQILLQGVKK